VAALAIVQFSTLLSTNTHGLHRFVLVLIVWCILPLPCALVLCLIDIQVIKKPMDLGTIKSKVDAQLYATFDVSQTY
jgi:hypothetical protein